MNVLMLKNLEIDLCNLIFCCGAYVRIVWWQQKPHRKRATGTKKNKLQWKYVFFFRMCLVCLLHKGYVSFRSSFCSPACQHSLHIMPIYHLYFGHRACRARFIHITANMYEVLLIFFKNSFMKDTGAKADLIGAMTLYIDTLGMPCGISQVLSRSTRRNCH